MIGGCYVGSRPGAVAVNTPTLADPETLHAPGVVQLDERRVSVVALRFEGFIDSIENLTMGEHVHKGQTLMRVSGPNLASAAAE